MPQRRGQKGLSPIRVAIRHQPNCKSVCGHLFTECISDKQKRLSNGGKKDIGKYHAALSNVFKELSEAELKQCEDTVVEWNTKPLPDKIQCK